MTLYTIGFTKKSAEDFFSKLIRARVQRVADVRLNNVSQLAGFSKRDDLKYFLKALGGIEYIHLHDLAPTQELLDQYKKVDKDWPMYESRFLSLMAERHIEDTIPKDLLSNACLLCSEDKPLHCHRRLVAEYLKKKWGGVDVVHL